MKDLFEEKGCFTTSITLSALRVFGPESLDWEPEVLIEEFEDRFKLKLPQKNCDKLNCGYALVGTTGYTDTLEGFLTSNSVLCGIPFSEDTVPFNSLKTVNWGVWEYLNLTDEIDRKTNKPTVKFHPDIIGYMQQLMEASGVQKLPPWLSFAELDETGMDAVSQALAADSTVFESYQKRQQSVINNLTAEVTAGNSKLTEQLKYLQEAGIIG